MATSLLLDNPNIAELQGVAVALELDEAGGSFFRFAAAAASRAIDFHVVVDDDAVVLDRGVRGLDGLAPLGDGIGEVDVVRLPGQRRQAHVYFGFGLGVEAAALVV